MKVIQEAAKFNPVVITIESAVELKAFNEAIWGQYNMSDTGSFAKAQAESILNITDPDKF